MKRNTCNLPSVTADELARVAGGANRVATTSSSLDSTTLLMFSQLSSSIQHIASAERNNSSSLLPLVGLAAAMHENQAPVAQQPLVIPIPMGGGWHHHHHRCR